MQREVVTVPPVLLRELRMTWDIDWRGQPPAVNNVGGNQVVVNAFPRWVGSPELALHGDMIAQWRAVRAHAQGRRNVYKLPMTDPIGSRNVPTGQGPTFSTGQTFSSGQTFAHDPVCTAESAASLGARSIRIRSASTPVVGQIMSVKYLPFVVTWVVQHSDEVFEIGIEMPLRANLAAGDAINMKGIGLFEVTEEGRGNPAYTASRFSVVKLSFQEWVR